MRDVSTSSDDAVASEERGEENIFAARVTSDEINGLPRRQYQGDIVFVRDDEAMLRVLPEICAEPVLGFDTETRPAFRKGQVFSPSLLQLGGANAVYIFQLQKIKQLDRLFFVLENPHVLKVGVALGFDVRKLQEMCPFEPRGFVELESMTDSVGIENNGLRKLTAIVLGFRISKGSQRSNWARDDLTQKQITYAATDAWVSRSMYYALVEAGAAVSPAAAQA